jgi:ankyrin repeat protein
VRTRCHTNQAPTLTPCRCGSTPLHDACRRGHAGIVRALLRSLEQRSCTAPAKPGAAPQPAGSPGAGNSCARSGEQLLEAEEAAHTAADVACRLSAKRRRTALHYAAAAGDEGVARLLLAAGGGAGVGWPDHRGRTALHEAAYGGHEGALRAMLAASPAAAVSQALGMADLDGRTPLQVCVVVVVGELRGGRVTGRAKGLGASASLTQRPAVRGKRFESRPHAGEYNLPP